MLHATTKTGAKRKTWSGRSSASVQEERKNMELEVKVKVVTDSQLKREQPAKSLAPCNRFHLARKTPGNLTFSFGHLPNLHQQNNGDQKHQQIPS